MNYTSINNIIGFGKYKNYTIKEIVKNDIAYIQWMVNQDNLKAKLLGLPKDDQNFIQTHLNQSRRDRIDRLEVYANSGFRNMRHDFTGTHW